MSRETLWRKMGATHGVCTPITLPPFSFLFLFSYISIPRSLPSFLFFFFVSFPSLCRIFLCLLPDVFVSFVSLLFFAYFFFIFFFFALTKALSNIQTCARSPIEDLKYDRVATNEHR